MLSMKNKKIVKLTSILIICFSISSCSNQASDDVIVVRSFTALRGEVTSNFNAYGRIRANRQVDLGSQASGQIQKINVRIGEEVHRGQVLAEIDATQLKIDLDNAQLAVSRSELLLRSKQSDYAFARTQLERENRLLSE